MQQVDDPDAAVVVEVLRRYAHGIAHVTGGHVGHIVHFHDRISALVDVRQVQGRCVLLCDP